jgi:energy-coupling factor transport system permease protein
MRQGRPLSTTTKLLFLIITSVACMVTYDTRFLLIMCLLSLVLFKVSQVKWRQVSVVVNLIIIFAVLNLILVYVFQPSYGADLYGSKHVLLGSGFFALTAEETFYLFNLLLKYICAVPIAILFLLTTNPSQFASSLNQIGISYRFSYAFSLALRYIPDIQESYWAISHAQQARGNEISKKAKLADRTKGTVNIVMPLILSSLDRITVISTAMELRRFGSKKKRTWYTSQKLKASDWLSLGVAVLLVLLMLYFWHLNQGRFYNPFK